jgi:hypothetical protein
LRAMRIAVLLYHFRDTYEKQVRSLRRVRSEAIHGRSSCLAGISQNRKRQ